MDTAAQLPYPIAVPLAHLRDAESGEGDAVTVVDGLFRVHDAIVRTASGREVWRWSHGRQFAQMLSELTLAPGESRELTLRWDPARAGGAAPGEGDYVAVGLIPALGASLESGPVAFSIRSAE